MTINSLNYNGTEEKKRLGAYIKSRRMSLGKSLHWLAEKLGVTPTHVRDIENGNRQIPLNRLGELSKHLEIPDSEIAEFYRLAIALRAVRYEDVGQLHSVSEYAHVAYRLAKDFALPDAEWQHILNQISK